MFKTRFCILLSVLALGSTQEEPQKSCQVSDDIEGECIAMLTCPRAMELIRLRDIATLRKITCGFDKLDTKVCCVTNKTDSADGALTFKPTNFNRSQAPSDILPPDPLTNQSPTASNVSSTTKQAVDNPAWGEARPLSTQKPFENPPYEAQYPEQSQIAPAIPPAPPGFGIASESHPTLAPYQPNGLPNRNECGMYEPADKIFGGTIAGLDEMPWLVRIKYRRTPTKTVYACHGSLISDRYVITAAHCVAGLNIIDVRLGEWDTEDAIDCINGECNDPPVDVAVEKSVIYPYYNGTLIIGDIALLRLAAPVNFTDFIRPICLPDTDYVARQDYDVDSDYLTGGWGKTEFEVRAVVKRKVTLRAVPMATCRVAIKRISDNLAPGVICAGGRKGEDSCAGDSGSSLVKVARENGLSNWFLYGVTSFGPTRCGTEGMPGIYTRTSYYMDWILQTIKTMGV